MARPLSIGRPTTRTTALSRRYWSDHTPSSPLPPPLMSLCVLQELAPTVVNLRDSEGRTALHLAVAAGNVPVVEALVGTN